MNKTDYHFHKYNDEWIFENYLNYSSYTKVAQVHNELFNTDITTPAMKRHCLNLGLKKPKWYQEFTEEEKEWLVINYPLLGVAETTRQFNDIFNANRTKSSIKNFGSLHGIQVNKDVATRNKTAPTHNDPISK